MNGPLKISDGTQSDQGFDLVLTKNHILRSFKQVTQLLGFFVGRRKKPTKLGLFFGELRGDLGIGKALVL